MPLKESNLEPSKSESICDVRKGRRTAFSAKALADSGNAAVGPNSFLARPRRNEGARLNYSPLSTTITVRESKSSQECARERSAVAAHHCNSSVSSGRPAISISKSSRSWLPNGSSPPRSRNASHLVASSAVGCAVRMTTPAVGSTETAVSMTNGDHWLLNPRISPSSGMASSTKPSVVR